MLVTITQDILHFSQGISVLEQEKLDNLMIEMDGTDNKCEPACVLCADADWC